MAQLRIASNCNLPVEAITETIAILGIRDSGKTNTAVVYVEELLAQGQQAVILDPTDVWWGLKSSADGLKPGFPVVILGGKHADLPLSSTDGKLIADFVVDERVSVICSLRGFESKQQELRFATDFLRRLYYRKGQEATPTPIAIVIDEASRLVPQRVMGEEAQCVGAVQQVVRQGRSSGFGVVLIDQRAATVNKDVLAMLEMLIVHRTTSPQDRKALQEWISAHDPAGREKEFLGSLASLKQGQAWFWSPGWLNLFNVITVRKRSTFDSSRTPRAGETRIEPKRLAQVDIDALRVKLQHTIEQAAADDPKTLRAEIATLQQRMKALSEGVTDEDISKHVAAMREAFQTEIKKWCVIVSDHLDATQQALREGLGGLLTIKDMLQQPLILKVPERQSKDHTITTFYNDRRPSTSKTAANVPRETRLESSIGFVSPDRRRKLAGTDIGGTPQKILNAIAFLEHVHATPSREAVAALVGISSTSGTFRTYLSRLRAPGLIADSVGLCLALTTAGRAAASLEDIPRTLQELHNVWLSKLGGTPRRMLEHLIHVYPLSATRSALALHCGIDASTGTFRTYLSRLRAPGLLRDVDNDKVAASSELFPKGLK